MADKKQTDKKKADNFELPSETIKKSKKRKKRNAYITLALIFAAFLIILLGVILAVKYLPNFKQVSPYDYYDDMSFDSPYTVINSTGNGERVTMAGAAVISNSTVYLSADFIKEFTDPYIFWEEGTNTLTITTMDKVIKTRANETDYFINHKAFTLNLPVKLINSAAYLPEGLLETIYDLDISYDTFEYGDSIVIYSMSARRHIGEITVKNANMRFEPTVKSPIAAKLTKQDSIIIYNEDGENGFTKVRANGLIGYIRTNEFEETEIIEAVLPEIKQYPPAFEGGVIAAWDQIRSYDHNFNDDKYITQTGLNVLIPTWFSFDADAMDGTIKNIADVSYVEFAHENDMRVWGLITDNFSSAVASAVLMSSDNRENVIKQLLSFAAIYDLDGINIDFEAVSGMAAPYYLQFLRELAPFTREAGLCLSVCMFVPTYTAHYNRAEVAKVVDYICVMAYDEHYGPASGAGPVASLGFVEDGIVKTLNEVPSEKIILGLPFYTRVWKQTGGDVSVEANLAMGYAVPIFEEQGATFEWLPDIGSYYGEYSDQTGDENIIYKTWLEDERSIEEKLKLYQKYDLAGVAGWSRNLETDEIWGIIDEYVNP